jgi:hypothetical protein
VEAWIKVRGLPPRWCHWLVFQQVASSLQKLADVDWYSLFSNHFEMVRLKIMCKDPTKIPFQRVVELNDELFLIYYRVEGVEQTPNSKKEKDDDDDDPPMNDDEDDLLGDDLNNTEPRGGPPAQGGSGQGKPESSHKRKLGDCSTSQQKTGGNHLSEEV